MYESTAILIEAFQSNIHVGAVTVTVLRRDRARSPEHYYHRASAATAPAAPSITTTGPPPRACAASAASSTQRATLAPSTSAHGTLALAGAHTSARPSPPNRPAGGLVPGKGVSNMTTYLQIVTIPYGNLEPAELEILEPLAGTDRASEFAYIADGDESLVRRTSLHPVISDTITAVQLLDVLANERDEPARVIVDPDLDAISAFLRELGFLLVRSYWAGELTFQRD